MTLTKQQALYIFRNEHDGVVRGDVTYTRENWNNFTDYLRKNGKISNHQYNNWSNPFWSLSNTNSTTLSSNDHHSVRNAV